MRGTGAKLPVLRFAHETYVVVQFATRRFIDVAADGDLFESHAGFLSGPTDKLCPWLLSAAIVRLPTYTALRSGAPAESCGDQFASYQPNLATENGAPTCDNGVDSGIELVPRPGAPTAGASKSARLDIHRKHGRHKSIGQPPNGRAFGGAGTSACRKYAAPNLPLQALDGRKAGQSTASAATRDHPSTYSGVHQSTKVWVTECAGGSDQTDLVFPLWVPSKQVPDDPDS